MKNKQKSVVRPAHIIFLVAAVVITLLLAWWQWTRFRSGSGTLQNLGYALQWPIFGGALVWAYRRYVSLESELAASEGATGEGSASHSDTSSGSDVDSAVGSPVGALHGDSASSHQGSTQSLYKGSAQRSHAQRSQQGLKMAPELMVPQRPTIDVEEFNRLNTPRRGHNEGDR